MSDVSQGPGWWQAADGKWYAPELHRDYQASAPADQSAVSSSATASDQLFPAAGSDQLFPAADSGPVFAPADSSAVFAPADSSAVFAPADSSAVFAPADSSAVFAPADGAAAPALSDVGSDPLFPVENQNGPSTYPSIQYPDVPTAGSKSKLVAGLLAIFLGALGIHRFYLGYKLIGAIMLLITVASLGRLALITVLWGIVEGILILTGKFKKDKYGRELT
jgi:TM2 domain-containing membrane protein YozV